MCPPRPCFTPTTLALALVALAHGAAHGQDNAPVLPAVQVTAKGYAASDLDTAASTLSLSRDALQFIRDVLGTSGRHPLKQAPLQAADESLHQRIRDGGRTDDSHNALALLLR